LSWPLPAGVVGPLHREVICPGGSPLTNPNSLHLVNRGFLL